MKLRYIIPKQLREEYKIFDRPTIFLKDVVTGVILLGLFFMFKNLVHAWLLVPYWIIAIAVIFFLIQPSASNPKKRNWEALILFLGRDRITYYSLNHVQESEDDRHAQ
ncbi:conserved protein of unknown function [Ruminococcaceae bacterium BL-6]|jgi:hypothetical protein|nr:conserved protein of unknown function [Ruminococcaceae bacterium BL-6]